MKRYHNRTLKEHKYFLNADFERFGDDKPKVKDWVLHNEKWYIWRFFYHLRCVEYHAEKKGILHKLKYLWHWYKYKHLSWDLHWNIRPFTLGPGAHCYHVGDAVYIGSHVKTGINFTFQCGVIIDGAMNVCIGDNVSLNLGVKVIKNVNIGNNVIVGANAVVTHDLPDNTIAVGVPARIIKNKELKEYD